MVAEALISRWDLGRSRDRFRGRIAEGRVQGPGSGALPGAGARRAPRVAVLRPQTYMNDAGRSVGPARGALKVPLERIVVVHVRVRVGVGRPDSTDSQIVSAHVLGRFREDDRAVAELIERAAEQVERIVLGGEEPGPEAA